MALLLLFLLPAIVAHTPGFSLSSCNLLVAQKRVLVRREVLNVSQAKSGLGNSQLGIHTEPLVK